MLALPIFDRARRIKVNPDAPQLPLRTAALARGIDVYMPTPRLRAGFLCLEARNIPAKQRRHAASLSGCKKFARAVPLDALPGFDVIVCGSVAVTLDGARAGKGEGYSDLEFAILRELGHPPAPVATSVHEHQIVDVLPSEPTDLPLRFIATPERAVEVRSPLPAPRGIDWTRLTDEDLKAMPVLAELRDMPRPTT